MLAAVAWAVISKPIYKKPKRSGDLRSFNNRRFIRLNLPLNFSFSAFNCTLTEIDTFVANMLNTLPLLQINLYFQTEISNTDNHVVYAMRKFTCWWQ